MQDNPVTDWERCSRGLGEGGDRRGTSESAPACLQKHLYRTYPLRRCENAQSVNLGVQRALDTRQRSSGATTDRNSSLARVAWNSCLPCSTCTAMERLSGCPAIFPRRFRGSKVTAVSSERQTSRSLSSPAHARRRMCSTHVADGPQGACLYRDRRRATLKGSLEGRTGRRGTGRVRFRSPGSLYICQISSGGSLSGSDGLSELLRAARWRVAF